MSFRFPLVANTIVLSSLLSMSIACGGAPDGTSDTAPAADDGNGGAAAGSSGGATSGSGGSAGSSATGGTGSSIGGPGGTSGSDDTGDTPPLDDTGATGDTPAPDDGAGNPDTTQTAVDTLTVRLVPQAGVSGLERVNFAVPLAPGTLRDEADVRVLDASGELSIASRALAHHADGSIRSLQIQADVALNGEVPLQVHVGEASTLAPLSLVPVESTLVSADGTAGPRVWALLPPRWLSASGVAGPLLPAADSAGTDLEAWDRVCDYERYDVDAFLADKDTASIWLYDRGTISYRGYARTGLLTPLQSAYRETALYRAELSGTGAATSIGVPGKAGDLKYHYTQNLALHYLLTGDDRFRESAEDVAERVSVLWSSPGYDGGADFWTERHAGFALLAYVWAETVSDDQAAQFRGLADTAVSAYLDIQNTYPAGLSESDARCFAHLGSAHGEPYNYFGCSPWMSAILADGLDAYARERSGTQADGARQSIVKLGRAIAAAGRDGSGKPYYWMGATSGGDSDRYDEHWGESAYVVAMAWHHDGRKDPSLAQAADELIAGFAANGSAPHMRSMNWQCRSAVATPYFRD